MVQIQREDGGIISFSALYFWFSWVITRYNQKGSFFRLVCQKKNLLYIAAGDVKLWWSYHGNLLHEVLSTVPERSWRQQLVALLSDSTWANTSWWSCSCCRLLPLCYDTTWLRDVYSEETWQTDLLNSRDPLKVPLVPDLLRSTCSFTDGCKRTTGACF